jgi:regulator of protease activity HflC (stomatin/prohibitin superfamily)
MSLLPLIFFVAFVIFAIGAVIVTFVPEQRAHQLAMERQRARFGTDGRGQDEDGDGKVDVRYPGRRLLIAGAILSFVAWIFFQGVVIVPAGYVGVVRFLGQVQPAVLYPGASWVIPFVNTIEEVDTRVQPHNFQQLTAATAENLQVTVTGTMNYHLDGAFAGQLIQNVGTDFASKIIDPAFSDYIKQVTPAYSADSSSPDFILNKRDEIRQLTKTALGENLARYHIIVDDIYIVDIGYPQAYNDAITAKQVEQQNVQREAQILEQRRIQAEQLVVTAQGQANANRETAAGQADANRSINESLTDELIQWQAIQKLNPNVNVMLVPEDGNFIFSIPSPDATPAPTPSP